MSSKREVKSPMQSVSIRSPMEKHMTSPPRSAKRNKGTSDDEEPAGSSSKAITFSSPTSTKGGSRR